jgi:hypothetical protein
MRKVSIAAMSVIVVLAFTPAIGAGQSPAMMPSPAVQGSALGSATDAVAWLGTVGFSNVVTSTDPDGQMRWVGTLPMTGLGADMTVELVGTPETLTGATFKTGAGSTEGFYAGDHIIYFVERFAPGHLAFVINALMRGSLGGGLDGSTEVDDRTITVHMAPISGSLPGEPTMSIVINVAT